MTEIEDMEQEILDTEEFNYHVESTIRRYKEILEEGNSTQRLVSDIVDAYMKDLLELPTPSFNSQFTIFLTTAWIEYSRS